MFSLFDDIIFDTISIVLRFSKSLIRFAKLITTYFSNK